MGSVKGTGSVAQARAAAASAAKGPAKKSKTEQKTLEGATDAFEVAPVRVKKHRPDRSGRVASDLAPGEALAPGDLRAYTDINTICSKDNIVTALFPDILVDPKGPESYNRSMMEAISAAKKFIVIEGYDLNRDDIVDKLIEKAKQGVQVLALFDPADSAREKKKGELLDRMRDAKIDNLHVKEYAVVPNHTKSGFEQILHVKKVITDGPGDAIVEHSGGINFSPNSVRNLDFGWRTEGLAVFDSLRHVREHWTTSGDDFPLDLKRLPDWNDVQAATQAKLKKAKLKPTEVEMASAGKLAVPTPRSYSQAKLLERAQLGKKIIISAKDAVKSKGTLETLELAAQNGSRVWIIDEGNLTDKQAEKLANESKNLKGFGIHLAASTDVIVEESYFSMVCRELDAAIENKESIELGAFALSHPQIIDRLIAAHAAGSDVKVVVDDLQIEGNLINKKAMALLASAGVAVRVVDHEVKARMAEEWGADAKQLKVHAKYLGIGGNRVAGGSANFSENGMGNNVEDGRLMRSEAMAKAASKRLFMPMWDRAKPVQGIELVADAKRVPLLPAVPVGTPISDIVFCVMDFETTGFVAGHDDRLLQMSARAMKVKKDGEVEVLGDYNQVIHPGRNPMGHDYTIPKRIEAIVGIGDDNLEARGAAPLRQALPEFVEFLKSQLDTGPVVLAGQNLPFDLRFLDHTLSRKELGQKDGRKTQHLTVDSPYVDCIDVSERLFPTESAHNLDAHMERFGIEHDPSLPRHDAYADVVYTAASLGKLIAHGKLKTLGDLLPPDLLQIEKPMRVYSSSRKNASSLSELNFNDAGKLQLSIRDAKANATGGGRRVYDLQVVGRRANRLEIAITTGKGDRSEVTKGWIDAENLRFRSGGAVYHQLRQEGADLAKPLVETGR